MQETDRTEERNDLKWSSAHPVEPEAGRWRMVDAPDPRTYRLPAPPANDSDRTCRELRELEQMTGARTSMDVHLIRKWSVQEVTPVTHWSTLLDSMVRKNAVSAPAAARLQCLMNQAVYCAMVACWRLKYHFQRPRPNMLDAAVDVSVIPVPEHPSYPAGHATVAGAAAAVLAHFFPNDAGTFEKTALESGLSRMLAGVHYRSDIVAGMELGRWVAEDVLRAAERDGGPQRYGPECDPVTWESPDGPS